MLMAHRALVDAGEAWDFGSEGALVERIVIGQSLTLLLDGLSVSLAAPFTIATSDGESVDIDPEHETLQPAFDLRRLALTRAMALKSGQLLLNFENGSVLEAHPVEGIEAWEARSDDYVVVCQPKDVGGLAVWTDLVKPTLSLVVIRTPDLERSRHFYEKLGLHFRAEVHGKGPKHYSANVGDLVMELYRGTGDIEAGATSDVRLGFRVGSFEDAERRLRDASLEFTIVDRDGDRVVVLKDPDGRKVELTAS
jgi:lactoylglutathione lyase